MKLYLDFFTSLHIIMDKVCLTHVSEDLTLYCGAVLEKKNPNLISTISGRDNFLYSRRKACYGFLYIESLFRP